MSSAETVGWSTAFGVISIAIVVSNSLTIIAFTGKQFKRKRSYYLPINLAVADLIVGMIALPLYIGLLNTSKQFTLNIVYLAFDITAGLTSVSSIALISVERLYAIGWPLKHRLLERKHYIIGIIFTWLFAVVLMVILCVVSVSGENYIVGARVMICAIGAPLLVTVAAYVLLYIMKKRSQANLPNGADFHRDNKLAKTLLIVSVVFFLTWTPFAILSFITTYSKIYDTAVTMPSNVFAITKCLEYSNSFANAIIYALRIPAFRTSLGNIFLNRRLEIQGPPIHNM